MRRVVGYSIGGAVGGSVFALFRHLGPTLLQQPVLIRWVFLYTLLGGMVAGIWDIVTRWTVARFSLSRRGAAMASGLSAGILVGGATLLVAALKQGTGAGGPLLDGTLLLGLPWTDGLGGFLGGAVGGGLWRYLSPCRSLSRNYKSL